MERESIVFYKSFFDAIDSLPEEEQAACYRAVIKYGLTGEEPPKGTLGYTMWLAFRKQIDVNQKRFENSKKKKKTNSNQSATKTEPNVNQTDTKHGTNVNVNENVNVNANVNENVNENVVSGETDIADSTDVESVSAGAPTLQRGQRVPYQEIVNEYRRVCTDMPAVRTPLSDNRKKKIRSRLKTFTLDEVFVAFQRAQDSDFLSGRNGKWTACDFDWFFTSDEKITHVLEGRYDNRKHVAINDAARELNDFYQMSAEWAAEKEGDDVGT